MRPESLAPGKSGLGHSCRPFNRAVFILAGSRIPGQVFVPNYGQNQTSRIESVHRHLPIASGRRCLRPVADCCRRAQRRWLCEERGKRGLPVVALEAHGESKRQPRLCFRAIRSFVFLTAQNSTWWNTTTPLPSAHTSFLTATGLERNAAFTPLHRRLGGGCCLKAEPQHHRQAKQPEGCASDAARGVEAFERQFGYPDKHQRPDRLNFGGLRPGQGFTTEQGFSKSLTRTIAAGAIGHHQPQVTDDSGPGATSLRQHAGAVGPEISAVRPRLGLVISLRDNYEIGPTSGRGATAHARLHQAALRPLPTQSPS